MGAIDVTVFVFLAVTSFLVPIWSKSLLERVETSSVDISNSNLVRGSNYDLSSENKDEILKTEISKNITSRDGKQHYLGNWPDQGQVSDKLTDFYVAAFKDWLHSLSRREYPRKEPSYSSGFSSYLAPPLKDESVDLLGHHYSHPSSQVDSSNDCNTGQWKPVFVKPEALQSPSWNRVDDVRPPTTPLRPNKQHSSSLPSPPCYSVIHVPSPPPFSPFHDLIRELSPPPPYASQRVFEFAYSPFTGPKDPLPSWITSSPVASSQEPNSRCMWTVRAGRGWKLALGVAGVSWAGATHCGLSSIKAISQDRTGDLKPVFSLCPPTDILSEVVTDSNVAIISAGLPAEGNFVLRVLLMPDERALSTDGSFSSSGSPCRPNPPESKPTIWPDYKAPYPASNSNVSAESILLVMQSTDAPSPMTMTDIIMSLNSTDAVSFTTVISPTTDAPKDQSTTPLTVNEISLTTTISSALLSSSSSPSSLEKVPEESISSFNTTLVSLEGNNTARLPANTSSTTTQRTIPRS